METTIFTLWTIVHLISGISLALIFSMKFTKFFKFIIPLPLFMFIFVNGTVIKIVSSVVFLMCLFGMLLGYLEKKKIKLKKLHIFILVPIFLIAWEIFEYLTSPLTNFGIELINNRISDVVVGFLGFLPVYLLLTKTKSQ